MAKKFVRRTPKDYDGPQLTTHKMCDILPVVLQNVGQIYHERPDLVLAAWPEIIGSKLAPMTQAVSFISGVLTVKVKNSTLHSLLSQNDKPRILMSLKQKFPSLIIKSVIFRIG